MEKKFINLGVSFHNVLKNYPERIAIKFSENEKYTYKELNFYSEKYFTENCTHWKNYIKTDINKLPMALLHIPSLRHPAYLRGHFLFWVNIFQDIPA